MTKMAKPKELSAAATVKINKAYNCPNKSSKKIEEATKFKIIDKK